MIDVLFFPDLEEGHIFPSFKLAHNLTISGYKVAFMGIVDIMELVSNEGFDSYPIFEEFYPKGYLNQLEKIDTKDENNTKEEKHRGAMLDGILDDLLKELAPKIIISSCFIALEALIIEYKYGIDQFIYSPPLPAEPESKEDTPTKLNQITRGRCMKSLHEIDVEFAINFLDFLEEQGLDYQNFEEIVTPILRIPHFVICPKQLLIASREEDPLEIYLGPGIRPCSQNQDKQISTYLPKDKSKKIIFASMGSQTAHYPVRSKKFFDTIIKYMSKIEMKDFHLILSISSFFDPKDFKEIPDNVSLFNWVPQVSLLPHVDLVFIHGGLGTIKECICHGLPMIVVPMGRDQFTNAKRIVHHGLGFDLNIDSLTTEKISVAIKKLQSDSELKKRILEMRRIFLEKEEEQIGIMAIENRISKKYN